MHPILSHLEEFPADLIVLATHRRGGLDRLLHKEIAQKIARSTSASTLFVPEGVGGFVSPSTGTVSLRQILIPVDWEPLPQGAVDAASAIASHVGSTDLDVTVLHVGGDELDVPVVEWPERDGWRWHQRVEHGDVLESIFKVASECDADLIVMAPQGHDGFLDALCGSTTERVLRHTKYPLLAVPSIVF